MAKPERRVRPRPPGLSPIELPAVRKRAFTLIELPAVRKRAFTLIELLVVIAIIAVLVMILSPSLQMVKVRARTVLCTTRLHDIGIANATYLNEQGPYIPRDYYSGMRDRYPLHVLVPEVLSQYLGGPDFRSEPVHPASGVPAPTVDAYYERERDDYLSAVFKEMGILQCPAQPAHPDPPETVTHPFTGESVVIERQMYSYVVNSFKFNGVYTRTNSAGLTAVHRLEPRDALAWLTDGSYDFLPLTNYDIHDVREVDGPRAFEDRLIDDDRHGGLAPVMFFDFHTEVINLEDVTRLDLWTPE